jgi:uncharacterized DUF497 family protein
MDFEWDEEKRLKNLEKHGIDFIDADILFGSPYVVAPGKTVDGERRWLATVMIDEIYVTAVFSWRDQVIRLISMRSARNGERKRHQEVFGN